MCEQSQSEQQEQYSNMVNTNTILLSFECWLKYIEGFTKGLEATEKVNSILVLDCIGEIMEGMRGIKQDVLRILQYCENILEENERLKLPTTETLLIEEKSEEEQDEHM